MMIYYCATNYSPFNVANGKKGWGTKLKEIHEFPVEGLLPGSSFLDNETGDVYVYAPVSRIRITGK